MIGFGVRITIVTFFLLSHGVVFAQEDVGQDDSEHTTVWRKVQERAKDTVVQIFVQTGVYNWLQPFKSPDHKKTYGSGFFIDEEGHIVSNFHVVEEACGVKIQIPSFGKEQFDVKVIGVCPDRDLALLKLTDESRARIKARLGKIPHLELGDSDGIVRTQEILALGYPLGQERLKSTQGIVSGREIVWGESYIQITAPLNPGNSGGPSLNTQGKVIGINTARIRAAQSIGYIIPINDVKSVIQALHKTKLLRSPILGGEYNYANKEMTQYLGNPDPGGLYIARVYKDTLFDRFGVKEGDMIYSINGNKLDIYGDTNMAWSEDKVPVVALLNRFAIGQEVVLEVYRRGQRSEIVFNFEYVRDLPIRRIHPGYEEIDYEIIGGLVIMQLSLNHLERFDDDSNAYKNLVKYEKRENQYEPRLLITHVFPTSQAQEARCLVPGDVIAQVNGMTVKTLQDLRDCIKKSVADTQSFITIKVEDKKFMVLSIQKVLDDEERLARRYLYKKTTLVKDLLAERSQSKDIVLVQRQGEQ
jgi:serine protease Do